MHYILTILLLTLTCILTQAQSFTLPDNQPIRYLALGDSYTIGQSVSVDERWPEQFRDSMEAAGYGFDTLKIIAATGWNTGSLLSAITGRGLANENYNLVSLLIGVNNQFQGGSFNLFVNQFQQLLDSAIVYAGGDQQRVFVVSIPDYGYTPFGQNFPGTSEEIDIFNEASRVVCLSRGIAYYDITPISRDFDEALVAGDGLHPSGYQYSLWVELIMSSIPRLITSAFEASFASLNIYPIPAGNFINISGTTLPFDQGGQLELIGADGSIAATMNINPSGTSPTSALKMALPDSLPSGMYILRITTAKGEVISRQIPIWR